MLANLQEWGVYRTGSRRRSDLSGSPERDRGFAVLGRDELVQSIREREHRATEFAEWPG
jgi:hypothetical protein